MSYKTKYWTIKNQHENKVSVSKMKKLYWTHSKTRQDKIRNNNIRESIGILHIVEKMLKNKIR